MDWETPRSKRDCRVMVESNYSVYRHVFPNGKQYVGYTSMDPVSRWNNGSGYKSQIVYRAIEKYGWDNIDHAVVRSGLSKEEALVLEKKLIKRYDLRNPEKGYNIHPGGDAAPSASIESRKKISEWRKNNQFGENNPIYGKSLTEEHKRAISLANTGRKHTAIERQKMRDRHCDVSGANNPHYGVPCSDETKVKIREANRKRMRPVKQYTLGGEFVALYESIREAVRQTGIAKSGIMSCCKKDIKYTHGFVFRYADEEGDSS